MQANGATSVSSQFPPTQLQGGESSGQGGSPAPCVGAASQQALCTSSGCSGADDNEKLSPPLQSAEGTHATAVDALQCAERGSVGTGASSEARRTLLTFSSWPPSLRSSATPSSLSHTPLFSPHCTAPASTAGKDSVACVSSGSSPGRHVATHLSTSPMGSDETGRPRPRRATMLYQPCLSDPISGPSGSVEGDVGEASAGAAAQPHVLPDTPFTPLAAGPRASALSVAEAETPTAHPPADPSERLGDPARRRRGYRISDSTPHASGGGKRQRADDAVVSLVESSPSNEDEGFSETRNAADKAEGPRGKGPEATAEKEACGGESGGERDRPQRRQQHWGIKAAETEEELLAQLSDEQQEAYRLVVKERRSVFITGGAGTGKSHLLRTIIKRLPHSGTFVTGTTGIAALNLGGTTVHGFAGCGIVEEGDSWHPVAHRIKASKRKREMWCRCRTLIIDEISMLSAYMFDMLEFIARFVRGSSEPFGGIQLVLSGDFLQLPPVRKQTRYGKVKGPTFAFESVIWLKVNPQVCLLSKPFRQRDSAFFRLLNEMRFGELSNDTVDTLSAMSDVSTANIVAKMDLRGVDTSDMRVASTTGGSGGPAPDAAQREDKQFVFTNGFGVPLRREFEGYTNLRSKRDEVAQQNDYYYNLLATQNNPEYMYQVVFRGEGSFVESSIQKLVKLRVGCRVMLIKNIGVESGLVNGSSGTVTGFVNFTQHFEFRSTSGVTRDTAREVARGRDGNLSTLHTMLPIVEFEVHGGRGTTIVVEPQAWEEKRGEAIISTTYQIPLILAYAITIHKSQGLSLTKVDIDLKSVFEAGQAYVALSRCTDLAKVRLHSFGQDKVRPDHAALAYYKALDLYRTRIRWQQRRQQLSAPAGDGDEEGDGDLFQENARQRRQGLTPYGYLTDTDGLCHATGRRRRGGCDGAYRRRKPNDNGTESAARPDGSGGPGPQHRCASTSDSDDDRDELGRPILREGQAEPEGEGVMTTESVHLDGLRQHVTKLLSLSEEVRLHIARLAMPAVRVTRGALVLDTTAIFYLITGRDSAELFRRITGTNENMLRLPRVVKAFLSHLADSVAVVGEQSTAHRPPQQGEVKAAATHGTAEGHGQVALPVGRSTKEEACEELEDDGPMALRALIEASADALALVDEWKASYILDEQRDGEEVSLEAEGAVLPAWRKFAEMLPLLQLLIPDGGGVSVSVSPSRPAIGGEGGTVSVSELDFLLYRDPREAHTHRGILEYALFLRRSFGIRVALCTDSPTLAGYALALDLPVVTVGALALGQ